MKNQEYFNYISNLSIKSMLYEVSATPKPGLVDRFNSGAHNDMGFFTFIDSSIALSTYFYNCSKLGFEFNRTDYSLLLEKLRTIGIEAEGAMLKATNGVNTHKGLIFSLGIIAAATGNLFNEKETLYINSKDISEVVKNMTNGLTNELTRLDFKEELTYGEILYKKYGIKGIRGEVESGFNTVLDCSLPIFKSLINENKYHINDILVQTLLHLIVHTEDSNILGRHGIDALDYAKEVATGALNLGGYLTDKGKVFVLNMDKDFINKNISPGGAADLLAITLMLYFIENGDRQYVR